MSTPGTPQPGTPQPGTPRKITVGDPVLATPCRQVSGTGFFARCLQHETDHLNGLLFIDHLPRNRHRKVLREMQPFDWNVQG